ncbi:hypothetical protein Jiend_15960 [Micromonospora endophytica]|nr:hypothetical protein Jiend_15960 [Micromonospora endophytica]
MASTAMTSPVAARAITYPLTSHGNATAAAAAAAAARATAPAVGGNHAGRRPGRLVGGRVAIAPGPGLGLGLGLRVVVIRAVPGVRCAAGG